MKIKAVKQIIKRDDYNDVTHKYLPLEYCCKKMEHSKYIELTNEEMYPCSICNNDDRYNCEESCELLNKDNKEVNIVFTYDDTHPEPWEDYYTTDTYYIPFDYCPFCGEKIEVEIVRTEDVTEKYLEVEKNYEELHKKWMKCDSIKRRDVFEKEWRIWKDKMDDIITFGEYQNDLEI